MRRGGDYVLVVIKEYIFPSLSHFDLIFIVLRREQARRRVRAARAEFNAILRLIRTFKAVNEDWPHVPSARPLPPPLVPPLPLTLFLFVFSALVYARAYATSKMCWYRGVHAAGALMVQHAKRILLYYY